MKTIASCFLAAGLALGALAALAQPYPSRPVRLVNPYPPGGATDITARAIATEMSKELGQPVVVENRAGAGANIGASAVAKSPPDGYTLLLAINALHSVVPLIYAKLDYDPNKDLTPVIVLVSYSSVLVVHPGVQAASVKELIALAKAQPGKLTFASSGSGSIVHMAGEMFKHLAAVDLLHVPYSGASPAMADLLGARVDMMFASLPTALPQVRTGKLRALGVSGTAREAVLPAAPTIAEAGVPGFDSTVWFALEVPSATPRAIVGRLNEAAMKGLRTPELAKRMTDLGFSIVGGTPEEAKAAVAADIQRWAPVVKAAGTKAD